jgi:uncharacterized protein (DUF1684 family)
MPATDLLLVSTLLLAAVPPAPTPESFEAAWRAWRDQRLASLQRPQGWLALSGLHWLKEGENRIAGLPGRFEVAGGQVTLTAAAGDGWTLGGAPVTSRRLASDRDGQADRVQVGSRTAQVIDRGGKLALRVWDAERPERRGFTGIDTFPPDPRWRLVARWEAYATPRAVEVPSVVGIPTRELAPGRAWFTVAGVEYALEPTLDGEALFFVFKDRTAPRQTYGAGRFLVAEAPRDGQVVLDFNRAYNPPCAFSAFATCPLPLPQNVLPVRIEAGEKTWGHR